MLANFTINGFFESVELLLSSHGFTVILGWMFAVAILIGGVLFHRDYKHTILSIIIATIFIAFEEGGRAFVLVDLGRHTSLLPIALVIIDGITFTLGIMIGYYVSKRAHEKAIAQSA